MQAISALPAPLWLLPTRVLRFVLRRACHRQQTHFCVLLQGSYCPAASGAAIPCPAGSFGSATLLQTSACSGLCSAGYFCPAGSTSGNAVANVCPVVRLLCLLAMVSDGCAVSQGSYCPAASGAAVPCPAGTQFACCLSSIADSLISCSQARSAVRRSCLRRRARAPARLATTAQLAPPRPRKSSARS